MWPEASRKEPRRGLRWKEDVGVVTWNLIKTLRFFNFYAPEEGLFKKPQARSEPHDGEAPPPPPPLLLTMATSHLLPLSSRRSVCISCLGLWHVFVILSHDLNSSPRTDTHRPP